MCLLIYYFFVLSVTALKALLTLFAPSAAAAKYLWNCEYCGLIRGHLYWLGNSGLNSCSGLELQSICALSVCLYF